ncbi:hypothetical protein SAMN05421543_1672 [Alicyclobacillus macrosporangiidus]|uniref:Uncharacterized protein n=1 Tax=Alicyclobacillus macrosporangiidus TaxID=392015 RepID=A0A1I7LJH5_9BACL|nr:hypothetical protein SAMN05421543_1672 [Alicyclobacillus macrosporangiidus]
MLWQRIVCRMDSGSTICIDELFLKLIKESNSC